jgi:hypothetical protein
LLLTVVLGAVFNSILGKCTENLNLLFRQILKRKNAKEAGTEEAKKDEMKKVKNKMKLKEQCNIHRNEGEENANRKIHFLTDEE